MQETEQFQERCPPGDIRPGAGHVVSFTARLSARSGRLLLTLAASCWLAPVVADQPRWNVCASDGFPEPFPGLVLPEGVDRESLPAQLDGDAASSDPIRLTLSGQASMQRGDQRLGAEKLVFNRETNVLTADGDVRLDQGGFTLFGERARMDVDAEEVRIFDAEYFYRPVHGRGTVGTLLVRGDNTAVLESASYTTCPAGERPFWALHGGEVQLDTNSGRGTAKNAVLRLGGVPVFYTPYAGFPIDDRRHTGLLTPRVGTSDRNGFDLTVPWYWNIAPDRDLTLYPRYMDRRGLMLGAEFRYLSRLSSGDVFGSFLPDDNQTGDDRYAYSWRHLTEVNRWIASLNYNKVSDDQFLEDFGNTLLASSASHLPQQGRLLYQADNWRARLTLQKYQTVDATIDSRNKPYELLPEFNLVGRWVGGPLGLTYHMDAEATSFDHDDKVDGNRLYLYPGISLPLLRSWGYFLPKVSLSHTQYDLENNPRGDDDISRTAPVVSVDSGLIFERPLQLLEQDWQQTLEPRLYYLYAPYRNQDDIPLFDTSRASEDYFWMFRENRFTGPDRLGDANQLTLALTSRLLDQGAERARFSFGQIRYFANRRVDLNPNRDPATFSRSDWFAEGSVNVLPGWSVWGSLQWNPDQNQTEVGRVNLRYNPHPGRLVNLAYRFTREERKQLDLATAWRLSERWRVMGRFYYSLRSNKLLEGLAGLEYESCCWTVRAAGRRFRDGADDPSADNAIFFELELKGLGGLGTNLNKVFAESINGYERTY